MTTVTGQVGREFKFADLEQFVMISEDGKFTLDLKKAKIKTKCMFGKCHTMCLTTYCSIHKNYSRINAKNNYRSRKRKSQTDHICIYPSCQNKSFVNMTGNRRTLCISHLKYHREYHNKYKNPLSQPSFL
jgi:chlorite dismutase